MSTTKERERVSVSTVTDSKKATKVEDGNNPKVWKVDKLEAVCKVCSGTVFDDEGCRRCRSNSFNIDGSKKTPLKIPESPL